MMLNFSKEVLFVYPIVYDKFKTLFLGPMCCFGAHVSIVRRNNNIFQFNTHTFPDTPFSTPYGRKCKNSLHQALFYEKFKAPLFSSLRESSNE